MLVAENLRKIYKNGAKEVRAVDGVSLKIETGSSIAIVGPSGAGKSTLLHILGALDRPTSGRVLFNGKNIYDMPDRERARVRCRNIGFVFQAYHLLPEFTALENVMIPALIKGQGSRLKGQGIRQRAKDVLSLVALADRMHHRPGELSGGESQRVAIARALVNEPGMLLCDEPVGNLDSKTSADIYELLFGLKASKGMAVVIVTHDEKVAGRTDRSIRVKDGKITE